MFCYYCIFLFLLRVSTILMIINVNPKRLNVDTQRNELHVMLLVYWCAAWIKMGEYYVNGYGGRRQPHSAAEMFSNAAYRGDSQVCQSSGSVLVH